MKLFVDDLRECPEGWELARTINEAIRILATGYVEEVSLDYDIRCNHNTKKPHCCETFEAVAYYIAKIDYLPIIHYHTGNILGKQKMTDILKSRLI